MKKLVLIFVVLTLVVAAAILFYNRVERAPAGAELVPDSTLLFAAIPDFPLARQEFQGTPLYALWREPEVQAFLEKPLAALQAANGKKDDSPDLTQLLDLLQGEVFLAVTGFTVSPKPNATVVLGADLKLRKPQALLYLKLYEHQLAKYAPQAKVAKKKHLGTEYTIIEAGPGQTLTHAFFGSMWVATSDEETMHDLIAHDTGNAGIDSPSLAASARYRNALSRLAEPHAARAFINVEELVRR